MKQRIIQGLVLLAATGLLATVLLYTRQLIAQQANLVHPTPPATIQRPQVAVTEAITGSYTATVEGYGEAPPTSASSSAPRPPGR